MESLVSKLKAKFEKITERASSDIPAINCPQEHLIETLEYLRDVEGFDFLSDVTAIDYYEEDPRFVVVYHLYGIKSTEYIRVATPCGDRENPSCPSVVSLWPTANWHEREVYDMFGIHFENHPDLRRILMWDSYPYHPLRKEFPLAGEEVELPDPDINESTGAKATEAPMMGGPFHSGHQGPMSRREPRADDESWTETKPKPEEEEEPDVPREFRNSQS